MTEPAQPKPAGGLLGWALPERERAKLNGLFPPTHDVDPTIQHHVTLDAGVRENEPLPTAQRGTIVGIADENGVQALVVEIDGTTTRPDGKTFHITWSLDRRAGRKPGDSNIILRNGWDKTEPVAIALEPRFFKS